jgi:hypothetical protein
MDIISAQSRDQLRLTVNVERKSLEESTRALRSRRNALAPISRLHPETLATIFTLLSAAAWHERSVHLEWIRATHVCRLWREAALNYPRFWSYINFTKLTPVGMAEILARAKTMPLHLNLEEDIYHYMARVESIGTYLYAHISHTSHLKIRGYLPATVVNRLVSPAPALESLSLSYASPGLHIIPDNFFSCTTPRLTSLKLDGYDVAWKSSLLKGLRILEIRNLSAKARPELNDWLDALNEMPQLKELSLRDATPVAPLAHPLISRTVSLPSLTHFTIDASAKDCALALAPLLLPTLTWLHVDIISHDEESEDVQLLIPYIARNVHVLQDIESIRSILIAGEQTYAEVCAWVMPDADVEVHNPATLGDMSRSACLMFSAIGKIWRNGVDTAILDALLTVICLNSVLTLTAHNYTRLSKEFWLRHASRLPLLEQARLVPTSVRAFREMLAEDTPPDGPRLPSLTRLILLYVTLTVPRTDHLGDMLIKRVEGVPVEFLDLSTCVGADCAIQVLSEIVVDVQKPLHAPRMTMEEFSKQVAITYEKVEEYDDWLRRPWYAWHGGMDDDEGDFEFKYKYKDDAGYDYQFDYNDIWRYEIYEGE